MLQLFLVMVNDADHWRKSVTVRFKGWYPELLSESQAFVHINISEHELVFLKYSLNHLQLSWKIIKIKLKKSIRLLSIVYLIFFSFLQKNCQWLLKMVDRIVICIFSHNLMDVFVQQNITLLAWGWTVIAMK